MSDQDTEAFGSPDSWTRLRRFSVLDPAGEPVGTVFPTVYVSDEILVDESAADGTWLTDLNDLASPVGWTVTTEDGEDDGTIAQSRGASTTIRARIRLQDPKVAAPTPDAWVLVRQCLRDGKAGIGLNHVLTTDSLDLNPFKANPFKANPFKANPFKANPFKANALTVGIDSYAYPGFGGLQPVTYVGPEPSPRHPDQPQRIVAILDTGCGEHPWLENVLVEARLQPGPNGGPGEPIGIAPESSPSPEARPSIAEPLDGIFDDAAGHGTFIAGIIRQQCPDARILPVRVADGEGVIIEDDLLGALGRLITFMDENPLDPNEVVADGEPRTSTVAVLNLSFSYYHEKPGDPNAVPELKRLLDEVRRRHCVVVCSAGNEATTRPTYPAAIPADEPDLHVSVGALNPSDRSVAMFSNIGDWVQVYAPGVSVLSTLPITFEGGLQSGVHHDDEGHHRETLDADDFGGGFGVWSGTSFAAPVVAGRIAELIIAGKTPANAKALVVGDLVTRDLSRTT